VPAPLVSVQVIVPAVLTHPQVSVPAVFAAETKVVPTGTLSVTVNGCVTANAPVFFRTSVYVMVAPGPTNDVGAAVSVMVSV